MRLPRRLPVALLAVFAAGCSAVSTANVSRTHPVTTTTATTTAVAPASPGAPLPTTIAPAPPPVVAPPRRSSAAPEVFVVGDSLTVGIEPWLADAVRARGWRLTGVDARVGRTVPEGLAVLKKRVRARTLPSTVIVALGTNNLGASDADIESWVSAARSIVGDERQLGWVNLSVAPPRAERAREIDAALATSSRRWNVQILDWYGWTHRNGITNKADGIHYEDGVYRLRALFYAAALPKLTAP
ncbi:MAG TPA: hypothetical protein VFK42_05495 [Acidimicrobiales bacterium]|jgi:hypothetical protein|nr:hypothetical protein [Acidimicrobiales bacterium]